MHSSYRTLKLAYIICIVLAIAVLGYYFIADGGSEEISKTYLLVMSLPFTVGGFLHFLIMYKTSSGREGWRLTVKKWVGAIGLIIWTILVVNFYVFFLL